MSNDFKNPNKNTGKWKLDFYQKLVAFQMSVIVLLLSTGVSVLFFMKSDVSTLLAYRMSDKEQIDKNTVRSENNEKRIYNLEWNHEHPTPNFPDNSVERPRSIIKPDQRLFRKKDYDLN